MITVIIPVYNVEAYLNRCVQSVVDQTYRDLEIILVDDGSTDRCPALCDEWAKKDERIRVIHQKNGGLSAARNAGLDVATGEWIGFVDSDDWVATDFYEILEKVAHEKQVRLVASGVVRAYGEREEFFGKYYESKVYSSEQALRTVQYGDGFHAVAWNKLYRREIWEGIRFPEGKWHEDEYVAYRVIDRAEKLALCQQVLYYYRQRSGSIMVSKSMRHLDALDAFEQRRQFFKIHYPKLYGREQYMLLQTCLAYHKQSAEFEDPKQVKERTCACAKNIRLCWSDLKRMTLKEKLKVLRAKAYFFCH